jgi:outer membrane protein OmpA-like peptidoglycan-associated protein
MFEGVLRTACLAVTMVLTPPAWGQDALSVEAKEKAMAGQGTPELVVQVHEPLRQVRVRLKGAGVNIQRTFPSPDAGAELVVPIRLGRPGRRDVRGSVDAIFPDRHRASLPLAFTVELLRPLRLDVDATPESVARGELTVRATDGRSLTSYRLGLTGARERVLGSAEGRVGSEGVIRWDPPADRVLRIDLEVRAEDGTFRQRALFPWQIDVPHEEVRFETGSAEIRGVETPKLEASLSAIEAALADVRPWADAKLFILGHTDRVGTAASNQVLSAARARSIGGWFRRAGVSVPVRVAGAGERQLRVQTADEVPEPANRRVEYIVAVEPPRLPGVAWKPLSSEKSVHPGRRSE